MNLTIGDALKSRENNFDAIRLVLHSHSFAQTGNPGDGFLYWSGYWGSLLGVGAFFIVSGFLVTASITNRDYTSYFISRFLRIFPALFVLSIVTAFGIGPFFTSLKLKKYLLDANTIGYLTTSTVFGFKNSLPGVFAGNPLTQSVNGSLWTLPLEVLCYLCLPWLYMIGALQRGYIVGLVAVMIIAAFAMATFFGMDATSMVMIAKSTPLFVFWIYAIYFLFGAMFYVYRFQIPLNGGLAVMSLLLMYAAAGSGSKDLALPAMTYLVFYLALARPCTGWLGRNVGDLSYGTYIWAFPIQQSIVSIAGPQIGPWMLQLIATPIVLLLAFLSWRFVEKPALSLKKRWTRRADKTNEQQGGTISDREKLHSVR